jgi:hypothetical protein
MDKPDYKLLAIILAAVSIAMAAYQFAYCQGTGDFFLVMDAVLTSLLAGLAAVFAGLSIPLFLSWLGLMNR